MKLHIEGDAFAGNRFNDLKEEMEFTMIEAIGLLVALWQGSQSSELIAGNKEEIKQFLAVPRPQRDRAFDALLICGYLKEIGPRVFEIRGNKKHIEALHYFKEMGRKGGLRKQENQKTKAMLAEKLPPLETSGSKSLPPLAKKLAFPFLSDQIIKNKDIRHFEPIPIAPISVPAEPVCPSLLEFWNTRCGKLPKALKLTPDRHQKWLRLYQQHPDIDYWADVVRRLSESEFCTGGRSARGWEANIDFFLQPHTHVKVLEGQFGCKTGVRIKYDFGGDECQTDGSKSEESVTYLRQT